MTNRTRRSVLRGSLALAAAGALARPYVAKAAATTGSRIFSRNTRLGSTRMGCITPYW
jgi:hypothetical protein